MSEETKKCPFCGEEILAVAVKCKHCGSDLSEKPAAAVAPSTADANENIGYILLLLPVIATVLIWLWIGNMNMFQNPGSMLNIVGFGTVIITAILVAYEAGQLGFGKVTGEGKKKESSPALYFLIVLLFWIIGYPLYLYQRSKKGKKNFIVGGIIVAILFVLSYFIMASAINEKVDEIRNILR
jgi:amino acid transporter